MQQLIHSMKYTQSLLPWYAWSVNNSCVKHIRYSSSTAHTSDPGQ